MTATTSIRTAAKTRLVDLLRNQNALAGVQVDYAWDGSTAPREYVWLGKVEGTLDYPVMMADRKQRDDKFTITVWFQGTSPGQSAEAADERVLEMFSAAEDLFAEDQTLNDLDGVIEATLDETFEGPDPVPTDEGYVSFIRAEVHVHSRLH